MACTTILVGKKASYDGSTMIARTEDSQSGVFTPKEFLVVTPEDQPRHYQSVLSKFSIDLPDNPLRYTSVPDALGKDGIWGEAGINSANVAMSATETITTNARVLGADPLVKDGFGEEDMLTLVLPYIKTAREGVLRLGQLLETYGTYESNGIAFSDTEEIWWLEAIGGHHWIARRVPDDAYVTNPNQLGIDHYEFENPDDYLASPDIRNFINKHHLDLTYSNEHFNPRYAFGSQRDKDRHYNTPRAWAMQKFLNPEKDYDPKSFFIPWCQKPYRKITVQWLAYGSMPFGTMVPFWTQVGTTPAYFRQTTDKVDTGNFYWSNRLIAAICDPHFQQHEADLDAYVETTMALGHAMINHVDNALANGESIDFEAENQKISDKIQSETDKLLAKVLDDASNLMTNRFSMSD